ncbi:MAG: alpha-2-macroglobulin family protein [Ferruginibacter sp.]
MKKILISFMFACCIFGNANAQKSNDYKSDWKKVADLEQKGLTRSALAEVMKIFDAAGKAGNEAQQIKAAMYQMKYRNMVEEANRENNIFYLDTLINKTKAPAKNILQSMQASMFLSYKQQNRYRLYNRTALVEENSSDINTWSLQKLNASITALFKASLSNESLLKSTALNGLDAIVEKGNSRYLRPTLYDFLAHRALEYFTNTENDVTSPAFKFILNDERIFATAKNFINIKFTTADTSSLYYNALLLMQDLLRFHINDAKPDALLDADLQRLAFANEHGVFTNKNKLYEAALKAIEDNYSNHPAAAQAMYLRASIYYNEGERYNPLTNPTPQFQLKKAKELLEQAIARFPKSEGGINAYNLLQQINRPSLNMETEKVNIPGQPFRSLVKYKNATTIYLRVIKTNREEFKKVNYENSEIYWQSLVNKKPVKSWSVALPDVKDLQQHSTEIKIDELPVGSYVILASTRPDFALSNNVLARHLIHVSNISYIYNNQNEIYVLNRDNGQPLAKATVQMWQANYNYNSRSYEEVKKGLYTTDKNGYIKTPKNKEGYNYFMQVKYEGDELFTDDNYYNYSYDGYERKATKRTFLFTDRSIYRPGQTIFFKGIMVTSDANNKNSSVLKNNTTTVFLYDVNNQKQGSIQLTSNEFGSYHGSFTLPQGVLNGQFYITDSVTRSIQNVSVEEYKRPKFLVEIKKPDGSYRVNDSITITGNAKAYAGNNIDAAMVSYRVVRKVRYPVWWWGRIWPPYGSSEEMEIRNGITTTNTAGDFKITFKAIPDETVDKKGQPVFYYEVTADVTDINGETRSGNVSVAVSYQALQLNIDAPATMAADSFKNIKISSTNINGIYEKATVNLQMFKLNSPNRIYRKRYWEAPDQFVMSKVEFEKSFPYDAYADEDKMEKWAMGEKLIDVTDTTRVNGKWSLVKRQLTGGWYKIIVTTKDKYGEEVRAEKYISLTDAASGKIYEPFVFNSNIKIAEPDQQVNYSMQSGFDNLWVIHSVTRMNDKNTYSYETVGSNLVNKNISVGEDDRGGINLGAAFVQHNRVYTYNENIAVPWTNKQLNISYETFRDKTLPGSEEKWKIKIAGAKGEKIAAEALLSMYDASLDQFKPQSWQSLQSLWPTLNNTTRWTTPTFAAVQSEERNLMDEKNIDLPEKTYDALINNGWNEGYYGGIRLRGEASMAPMANRETADQSVSEVVVSGYSLSKSLQGKVAGVQVRDEEKVADTIKRDKPQTPNNSSKIRTNFNETAFFFPVLNTDANGNIEFSFTIPAALTTWKMMSLAHTKDLASGYAEKTLITQKPLMVQPNAPRFLREGDQMEFSAKIVNLSGKQVTGIAQLELFDAATNKPVDGMFKNFTTKQNFIIPTGESFAVKFPITIPYSFNSALTYRIKAVASSLSLGEGRGEVFSDGEEAALPVLTNRMLVTETLPLNIRNTTTKSFRFDKLLTAGNSGSLTHQALTIEFTSNPAWYTVQALPYLMEYPYQCAEQNFNRYYANVLASFISNSTPKIKAVFDKWKTLDTAALMSNLQKNEELKNALLQETPWVLQAQNETQQKKNIALLFDMIKLSQQKISNMNKLKEMQTSNGGFTWFKGGPDDRYITQYILSGIGHLKKLNALNAEDLTMLKPIIDKALPYLDARLKEEYDNLIKYKVKLDQNNLSSTAIQYLYMRSFFTEPINTAAKTAYNYYSSQSAKYWLSQSKYMQGMIALALYRQQNNSVPKAIIESLKQNAITNEEMGMYWKEFTTGGYYWQQAPIESQALMIEAFTDIDKNNNTIDDLKTWLLKNKQTNQWHTTKATAEACYALLLNGNNWLAEEKNVTIQLGNTIINSADEKTEAGTGYFKKTIEGSRVQQGMGNINVKISPAVSSSSSTVWGAVYWQYFEDLDKITSATTPLKLVKKLFVEKNTATGPRLIAVNDGDQLHVGDKIKVRIELRSDRDMEYVHMKDMRAACMEPVNVISSYKWQGGLGYYESTKDASTSFFFSYLPKGTYVFEYPMFVTHAGNFSNGITNIQCMYAPEFSSHSEGVRVSVK